MESKTSKTKRITDFSCKSKPIPSYDLHGKFFPPRENNMKNFEFCDPF